MSEHASLCQAAFCASPLSIPAQAKLLTLPNVDWTALWSFFLQHKSQFLTALEAALNLLPGGATWTDLLKIIEDILNNLPTPTPTPTPAPTPAP